MILLLFACLGLAAEEEYQRGVELARQKRFEEARAVFRNGRRQCPSDKRFALGLAGLDYRQQNNGAAKSHLKEALGLDPRDAYANDFLATLYFLDSNIESALKYWNRAGKPRVQNVTWDPGRPGVDPVLLDRSLAFAPASVLTLAQYRATRAWLGLLGPPWKQQIELVARPEKDFDVVLRLTEPVGWLQKIAWLRSLPFQAAHADLHHLGEAAIQWTNMVRWDAQKRRFLSALAGPLRRNPRQRFVIYADLRKEVWNFGERDFRFQKISGGAEFVSVPNGWVSWRTGIELSSERLRGVSGFPAGLMLKYRAAAKCRLLNVPDQRLSIDGESLVEIGRIFSSPRELFSRSEISFEGRWFPRARGPDFETRAQFWAGKAFGALPLGELYMLGAERDNHLWLRGHPGTRDGKKGSAPIGSAFLLTSLESSKQVYNHPLFSVQVGPFVDIARVHDVMGRFTPGALVADPGVQVKVRALGAVTVNLSYGWDVRSGRGLFYSRVEQ